VDLGKIAIRANHIVTDFRETPARDQTDISRTDHCDFQSQFLPLNPKLSARGVKVF